MAGVLVGGGAGEGVVYYRDGEGGAAECDGWSWVGLRCGVCGGLRGGSAACRRFDADIADMEISVLKRKGDVSPQVYNGMDTLCWDRSTNLELGVFLPVRQSTAGQPEDVEDLVRRRRSQAVQVVARVVHLDQGPQLPRSVCRRWSVLGVLRLSRLVVVVGFVERGRIGALQELEVFETRESGDGVHELQHLHLTHQTRQAGLLVGAARLGSQRDQFEDAAATALGLSPLLWRGRDGSVGGLGFLFQLEDFAVGAFCHFGDLEGRRYLLCPGREVIEALRLVTFSKQRGDVSGGR